MRARNRDISIFNLSMLDVITGAMAAFLIIMVVLLPYYRKEHIDYQAIIADLERQLATTGAEAAQLRRQLAQAEARNAELARRLAKTFLVLYVRWSTRDDVDLHVIDPSGARFYFERKIIAGRPGVLSEDTLVGPGNEVWEVRDAPPGDYRIEVQLFEVNDPGRVALVQGRVFHRDGSNAFPEVRLSREKQMKVVATINIAADGSVTLR
ncbi:hypothetical protein [uncultured Thiohalocapsa sp.]|uniref:YfaP family protein n=1 Tax=uncultured Thiohalocapsa sp. TaxID=768990 RepID=UPI0025D52495|nr:hypothetical protein [uncultured Thiohalocapsa sp.]